MHDHFSLKKTTAESPRTLWREGVLPLAGIIGITFVLVAVFATFLYFGKGMGNVFPPHIDEGESVDPNPMRLIFMCLGFVISFVIGAVAERRGKEGKIWPAFWLGYAGGTLLWQSVGESSWHFGFVCEDYLICFTHLETSASLLLVVMTTVFLLYCAKQHSFGWGAWVFILSFVGNWFGHFSMIGTYPMVHTLMDEETWYRLAGLILGLTGSATALWLNFRMARDTKARLCCCLFLFFSIGTIVTGVAGL